jgi:hypothetical protein
MIVSFTYFDRTMLGKALPSLGLPEILGFYFLSFRKLTNFLDTLGMTTIA